MSSIIEHEEVFRIAYEVRQFIEPKWSQVRSFFGWTLYPDKCPSKNMCGISSSFLCLVLSTKIPGEGWRVVGGSDPDPFEIDDVIDPSLGLPGGYRDPAGVWYDHHWVQNSSGTLAVDITQDQFGGPTVATIDLSRQDELWAPSLRRNWLTDAEDALSVCYDAIFITDWMTEWIESRKHYSNHLGDTQR